MTIWRALRDAPTTPRIAVTDKDLDEMEAERPKRKGRSG